MIETREKQINGSVYICTQLPARRALRMKAKLLRIFGPALAQLFLPGGKDQRAWPGFLFQKEKLCKAIESLMSQLDDKTFESLVLELCQGVRKEGMELTDSVIDVEFAGDLPTLMQVFGLRGRLQFRFFFWGERYWRPIQEANTDAAESSARYEKNLHTELKDEFLLWRLVLEGIASLEEIERTWNLDDLLRANALLDMRLDLMEESKRKGRRNDSR